MKPMATYNEDIQERKLANRLIALVIVLAVVSEPLVNWVL